MKRFAEEDALAWDQNPADAPASANHVQKRLQKRKGVEVAFDPKAHRFSSKQGLHYLAVPASSCSQCLTLRLQGLPDRLQEAQGQAAQLDDKARKQKQVERAEKKAKLRADLQLERYESHSEQEGEDSAVACATVHVLQSPLGQTSTVTIAPFSLHSDEEPAGNSDARCAGYTCWLAQCEHVAAQSGEAVPASLSMLLLEALTASTSNTSCGTVTVWSPLLLMLLCISGAPCLTLALLPG
eukprot:jgi/Astpho2/9918/fgenesh1_pg.00152_%23_33_t